MFILLYTILGNIALLLAAPFLFILIPFRELLCRFGFARIPQLDRPIWFHCASVGEVNAIRPLLVRYSQTNPGQKILVTTMTRTGLNIAKSLPEVTFSTFIPFDSILLLAPFIKRVDPRCLVIVETELWPALIHCLGQKKVPIVIVNGRISDKSFGRYQFMEPLFKNGFRHILAVGAQSPLDVKRFKKLGFKTVENTHNLKFSLQLPEVDRKIARSEWGIEESDFVLVWGSSRPGEEELLKEIHPLLNESIPNLKLIIAPRHLNRLSQVKEIFKNESTAFLSEISLPYEILIIDSLGVLYKAYALSDIAVVGGSFFDFGGHNPLEPAFYSIPTIIGNFHSSCRHVVNELLKADAIIVANKASLVKEIVSLYQDKTKMYELGFKAKNVVNQNSFSLVENLSLIQRYSK